MPHRAVTRHWNEYLEAFQPPATDVYFTEEYARLYERDGLDAECFVYAEGDRVLLLPYVRAANRFLSGGRSDIATAYGYGGPISNTDDARFNAAALAAFEAEMADTGTVSAFLRFHPVLGNHRLAPESWDTPFDRQTVAIPLTVTDEQLWDEHFDGENRNRIRKAEANHLEFRVDANLDHLGEFMDIYYHTMDLVRARDFYYFDRAYFEQFAETLRGNALLTLVYNDERVVAANLCLHQGPYCHGHLTGSLREYRNMNPNNLLLYKTLLYYRRLGFELFHLGGGATADPTDNLFRFKRHFSKVRHDFHTGRIVFDQAAYTLACDLWRAEESACADEATPSERFPAYGFDEPARAVAV